MFKTFIALAGLLSAPCMAATLAPDSLICESPSSIAFVSQDKYIAGAKGSYVIASAGRSVQLAGIMRQAASLVGQQEERRRLADLERDRPALEQFQTILKTCASSGAEPVSVQVIEFTPISGIAKIMVMLNGHAATVYVNAAMVSP